MGAAQITGEHVAGQAEGRALARATTSSSSVKRDHREHRPEDLVAGDVAVVVDVAQHGRGEVATAGQIGPLPEGFPPVASRLPPPPWPGRSRRSPVARRLVHERAHERARIEGIADGDGLGQATTRSTTSSKTSAWTKSRVGRAQPCPLSNTAPRRPAIMHAGIEVGVGEDDVGRLAAELEGQRGQRLGGVPP